MINVLVVGFGGMGCRHAQSLLSDPDIPCRIVSVEPNTEKYQLGLQRIGSTEEQIKNYMAVDDVPHQIDVAIIATTSGPRFAVTKQLIEKGVKYFLLEKIVFQSEAQFEEISALLEQHGAVAYCNFVNRYFDNYNFIRNYISQNRNPAYKVKMDVTGGEFGVGCNAIHYIDLFCFLTSSNDTTILSANLKELESGNKRGKEYTEFSGTLFAQNSIGDTINITSFHDFNEGIVTTIRYGDRIFKFHESRELAIYTTPESITELPFLLLKTSKLTSVLVKEMLDGTCRLTTVQETRRNHAELFRIFNDALSLKQDDLCPVT